MHTTGIARTASKPMAHSIRAANSSQRSVGSGAPRAAAAAAPPALAAVKRRRHVAARSSADPQTQQETQQQQQPEQQQQQQQQQQRPKARRQAESTDAIATFMTRRFGLAGGLAWLGFLAVGTLGEQVKTRLEVAAEQSGARDVEAGAAQEVVLPSGVRYTDRRVGGGQAPAKGMLVVLSYVGRADGQVFEDTKARGKPIVLIYGARPFTGGLCAGVEEALATMRAGGRRAVTVPPALGFGDRGAVLRPTEHVPEKQGVIPPGATLEYEIELVRVSVPPS